MKRIKLVMGLKQAYGLYWCAEQMRDDLGEELERKAYAISRQHTLQCLSGLNALRKAIASAEKNR